MKKTFLLGLAVLITCNLSTVVVNAATQGDGDTTSQVITEISDQDKQSSDSKLKLTEEYMNRKSMLESYGSYKVMTFPTVKQEQSNWCGPGTAYNVIKGLIPSSGVSQYDLYKALGTGDPGKGGTPFPGSWLSTLKSYAGNGNNYQAIMGSSYSTSDWFSKVKNCVIYTVDKGYPVIADTKQDPYGVKLHPKYNYIDSRGANGTSTYHYIAVTGYDDTVRGSDSDIYYSDCHTNFNGNYWTKLSTLSSVTKSLGILW